MHETDMLDSRAACMEGRGQQNAWSLGACAEDVVFFLSSWTDHGISYYCAIRALQLEATHCMFAICAWNVTETLLGEATVFYPFFLQLF